MSGEVEEHTVVNTFVHDDDQIVYLTIDSEEIETTPWHQFYTDDGWEDAGDLQPGDLILSLDGDYGVVESMVIVDETQTMYDLDVETVDTFAVGDGVLNLQLATHPRLTTHALFVRTANCPPQTPTNFLCALAPFPATLIISHTATDRTSPP